MELKIINPLPPISQEPKEIGSLSKNQNIPSQVDIYDLDIEVRENIELPREQTSGSCGICTNGCTNATCLQSCGCSAGTCATCSCFC